MSFILGYELEFASKMESIPLISKLVELQLPPGVVKGAELWYVGGDESIVAPEPYIPYEISSAAMDFETGLAFLPRVMEWLQTMRVFTNNTTGMHVNLSFKDHKAIKRLDPLKLIALLDEDRILKSFKRSKNGFCQGHQGVLRYKAWNGELKTEDDLRAAILAEDKDMFVNLTKLADGYLEFRGMGNKNYHRRGGEIVEHIHHFTDCMVAAMSHTYRQAEFKRNVQTILRGE